MMKPSSLKGTRNTGHAKGRPTANMTLTDQRETSFKPPYFHGERQGWIGSRPEGISEGKMHFSGRGGQQSRQQYEHLDRGGHYNYRRERDDKIWGRRQDYNRPCYRPNHFDRHHPQHFDQCGMHRVRFTGGRNDANHNTGEKHQATWRDRDANQPVKKKLSSNATGYIPTRFHRDSSSVSNDADYNRPCYRPNDFDCHHPYHFDQHDMHRIIFTGGQNDAKQNAGEKRKAPWRDRDANQPAKKSNLSSNATDYIPTRFHRNSSGVSIETPSLRSCLKKNKGPTEKVAESPKHFSIRQAGSTVRETKVGEEPNNASSSQKEVESRAPRKEMGPKLEKTGLVMSQKDTHVLFVIDFSSSMKERDIKTSNGKISRWEAVFECIDSFLREQLQQQHGCGTISTCLVSVILFNDNAQVIMKRVPLVGEGTDIRTALEQAKTHCIPKGGTGFSAGFQQAEKLTRSYIQDKVVLVFLSDGRPGDLCPRPPSEPTTAMQATFKRNGVTFNAAGHYIEVMKERHNGLSLQLICLYDEGVQWLKYLASHYSGIFHNPDLTLDATAQQPCPLGHDEEDEVVDIFQVKSQETLIREQHQRAKAAGKIVSLTNMSTEASSIRSTFTSISATVTAMRSRTKLSERAVTIKHESAMIGHKATRMVLTSDDGGVEKFAVAPGESANERRVEVSMHPFSQGGLRNVYRMKQKCEKQGQVAKESRHAIKYSERLKFHLETVKCQTQAALYASSFNKKVADARNQRRGKNLQDQAPFLGDVPTIDVLCAEVYRLKAPSCPGGFRYLAVEDYLEGNYEKWNNNDGFVNNSDCLKCKVAQAFSHFSYECSDKQEMVVDIQGSGNSSTCVYTDPQLHSVKKEFGRADRGTVGIDKFFTSHQCNFICKALELPRRSGTS